MNDEPLKGTQVRSGEKFGIQGFWVNRDQTQHVSIAEVPDADDIVGGLRDVFIYFGATRPNRQEIEELIANTPPVF